MLNNCIKDFRFTENRRSVVTLSDADKIRMPYGEHKITLKDSRNIYSGLLEYPLDTDINVRTWVTNPNAVTQWRRFGVWADIPTGTSIGYRLSDGTADFHWDGAAWSTPGAGDWNTELEIAEHIPTFPVTEKKIAVIANLLTTDPLKTPTLYSISILYDAFFMYIDDLIVRSLVRTLEENIRFPSNHSVTMGSTTAFLNLSAEPAKPKGSLVITNIIAAFNHTADPDHATDILSDFNPTTQIATFTSSQTAGSTVWLVLEVKPDVVFAPPSQDYYEIERLPALLLENMSMEGSRTAEYQYVIDKFNAKGETMVSPFTTDVSIDIVMLATRSTDLLNFHERVLAFLKDNPLLATYATDERYTMLIGMKLDYNAVPSQYEVRQSRLELIIKNFHQWPSSVEVPLVEELNIQGGNVEVTIP